jgi:hypothetical protein
MPTRTALQHRGSGAAVDADTPAIGTLALVVWVLDGVEQVQHRQDVEHIDICLDVLLERNGMLVRTTL